MFATTTYALITYVTGHYDFANYLAIPHIPEAGEVTVFCAALAGASAGFLWFNSYPAEVFMGDTGSLCLGGALGAIAVLMGAYSMADNPINICLLLIGLFLLAEGSLLLIAPSPKGIRHCSLFG